MASTLPLILHVFDKHYDVGKELFEDLSKKIKSKKSIALEDEFFFISVYTFIFIHAPPSPFSSTPTQTDLLPVFSI